MGKPSYGDLERALILGNKRRLNIKSLKEIAILSRAVVTIQLLPQARIHRGLSLCPLPLPEKASRRSSYKEVGPGLHTESNELQRRRNNKGRYLLLRFTRRAK